MSENLKHMQNLDPGYYRGGWVDYNGRIKGNCFVPAHTTPAQTLADLPSEETFTPSVVWWDGVALQLIPENQLGNISYIIIESV